ncbi:protein of unknown function DUF815 [Thermosinus carboxydivorans Nor1]|uniref:AAA+ ATPase domain-containing protein n=1 Tax=Thermosinus carboxydivorans Nor1 TaxID=401526 RepID=A1HPN9_9FIRM|nr:ATP-binding protein [Thermosinus carboxydivorans]EAX48009.1 protein of unknown function DUF815 [Thermosinus carboxydivorans Nor1]
MATVFSELEQLLVYRKLLADVVIKKLMAFAKDSSWLQGELASDLITKAEELGLSGNLINSYLIHLISFDNNVFSRTAEKTGGKVGASLLAAAAHDIAIFRQVFAASQQCGFDGIILNYTPTYKRQDNHTAAVQEWLLAGADQYTAEQVAALLSGHYARYGYGEMASCKAFRWDKQKGLVGVKHIDPIQLEDIVGYERQKKTLLRNTEAFLAGKPAHNVLLVGARGTGKSSSVKALANRYYDAGLRLIEVTKNDLTDLPAIMNAARQWGKKFIVFIDDLSFEETEAGYKQLKSVMDGGVETKPDNVLIYATSNRRRLIRETWQDRAGDEVHHQDTIHEKISLADRFGITLTYPSPNQDEYLRIVEDIARKNNVDLPTVELRAQALRWEMAHSGRSGRIARQFVDDLISKISCG